MTMCKSRTSRRRLLVGIAYLLLVGLAAPAGARPIADEVIQALIWTGDYDRLIDTAPPDYTEKAIRSFQRRQGFFETGELNDSQKQLLFAMARQISEDVGAKFISDPRTGTKLVVPLKYVTDVVPTRYGTLLSGSHRGPFALATFALPGGHGTLEDLYESMSTTIGGRTAKTRFKKLERNRMILVRIHSPLRTYVFATHGPTGIRGFIMTWSLENTELLHRVVGVAANSFAPSSSQPAPAPKAQSDTQTPRALDARDDMGSVSPVRSIVQELANHRLARR